MRQVRQHLSRLRDRVWAVPQAFSSAIFFLTTQCADLGVNLACHYFFGQPIVNNTLTMAALADVPYFVEEKKNVLAGNTSTFV